MWRTWFVSIAIATAAIDRSSGFAIDENCAAVHGVEEHSHHLLVTESKVTQMDMCKMGKNKWHPVKSVNQPGMKHAPLQGFWLRFLGLLPKLLPIAAQRDSGGKYCRPAFPSPSSFGLR